jgi:OOP family OmpA-OmpF porin
MKKLLFVILLCPLFIRAQDALKTYNNYDFVPGDTILFEDHFSTDQPGEFPEHWELVSGQAVMNTYSGSSSMLLTAGNYCVVKPRMKTKNYLSDRFSIEFDTYQMSGAYGIMIFLRDLKGKQISLQFATDKVTWTSSTKTLTGEFPAILKNENYRNKWHHIAIAYKEDHLKVYVDQYRVLSVPECDLTPATMDCDGIGNDKTPIVFTNMKIAKGAGMYVSGQKFTDTKIITHGINFDVDKSTIRPESMGTLNMIVQVMKDNADIKFEVDGHTDNTGTAAHNLTLSKQRADAVKDQLVKMGIDGSRLTTKGLGDTKPISDNTTPEGKANNRRVEFVKM